jgi:NAD(P)H-dependent FMN reductase
MASPSKLRIAVVLGSTREGRYGDKPAHWITARLNEHAELAAELIDLRDWPLPFFDARIAPARVTDGKYGNDTADRFAATIAAYDGFVIVAAEYNHGYTAVLKNALDWTFREWSRKPVTFVGYGGVGGARAVEQLRQVAIEMEMAPIRRAVHLSIEVMRATMTHSAPAPREAFAGSEAAATLMVDELVWWAHALRSARAA